VTDLDKIKACARAMGLRHWPHYRIKDCIEVSDDGTGRCAYIYNPLDDSAQADALEGWLLERGRYTMYSNGFTFFPAYWAAAEFEFNADMTLAENRRRARVECVAKMMEGEHGN